MTGIRAMALVRLVADAAVVRLSHDTTPVQVAEGRSTLIFDGEVLDDAGRELIHVRLAPVPEWPWQRALRRGAVVAVDGTIRLAHRRDPNGAPVCGLELVARVVRPVTVPAAARLVTTPDRRALLAELN